MKILVSSFTSPGQNTVFATGAITITFLALVHTLVIGPVSILVMFALWLPLYAIGYKSILRNPWPLLLLLMLPAYAMLSTFWSAYPNVTIRASVQYLSLVLCAIAIGRCCRMLDVVRGMAMAAAITLVISMLFGKNAYDPIEGLVNFAGLLGNKNQVGMVATFAILLSYCGYFYLRDRGIFTFVYMGAVAIGAVALVLADSATSVVTVVGALGAIMALRTLARFPAMYRRSAMLLGVIAIPVVIAAALAGDLASLVLEAFGKDSTLTGRTYLWSEALRLSEDVRAFGWGYAAFWVQGQLDAERLWYEFYIDNRSGFHFHNLYIETLVELGVVGLIMMLFFLVWHFVGAFVAMMNGPTRNVASTILGVFILLLARSFSEVDFLGPFGVGALVMFSLCSMLSGPEIQRARRRMAVADGYASNEVPAHG